MHVALKVISLILLLTVAALLLLPTFEQFDVPPTAVATPSTTSRTLFRDAPDLAAFRQKYALLKPTLDDRDDPLQLDSCITIKPEFMANWSHFQAQADIYTRNFELSTPNFEDVRSRIVTELKDAATTIGNIAAPVYVLIMQAPFYPADLSWEKQNRTNQDTQNNVLLPPAPATPIDYSNVKMISLMNFNAKDVYLNAFYNTTLPGIQPPPLTIQAYLLFPRHAKDGQPQLGRNAKDIQKRLKPIFSHSRDALCYMKCPGESSSFCGCLNKDAKGAQYGSTCLGPGDHGDKLDYANVYTVNTGAARLLDANLKSIFNDAAVVTTVAADAPVQEWPPRTILRATWNAEATNMITSLSGGLIPRVSTTLTSGDYGKGVYTAWTNSIWNEEGGDLKRMLHPGEMFSKVVSASQPGWNGGFWHVSSLMCTWTNQSPLTVDKSTPYVAIALPTNVVLRRYALTSRTDCCPSQMPTSWILYGANDESNWTQIDAKYDASWSRQDETQTFSVPDKDVSAYSIYKIATLRNGSPTPACIHIGAWKMWGVGGGAA